VIGNRLSSPRIKALFESGGAEAREAQEDILDSAALLKGNLLRAHKLVETFKKISVSQATENREEIDLPDLAQDVVDLFKINARQAQLDIAVDASGVAGSRRWLGYPGYLTQVLLNFLQNIERYAYPDGQGGKVDIRLEDREGGEDADGPSFAITVQDYGAGISPEHLAHVFEPFFTTGRGKGGSGLGLAIVNTIVTEALRGSVSVASEPGLGTRFTVAFPKRIPAAVQPSQPGPG
jgi:signal transduction histidine kinase